MSSPSQSQQFSVRKSEAEVVVQELNHVKPGRKIYEKKGGIFFEVNDKDKLIEKYSKIKKQTT